MKNFRNNSLCFVSIIIPCRDEEKFIGKCIDSIIAQDYPKDRMEALIIDGGSKDKTTETVNQYIKDYPFIKLLNNPYRVTSCGLNIGVKETQGKYMLILSSHAYLDSSYISTCLNQLREKNADCVGGKVVILADNFIEKAIALARSSLIGGSILPHRYSKYGCFVRTVAYGLYKREVFDKVGLFDEELIHNQDEEFNWRLIKNGFKIYFTPEAEIYYKQKRNLLGLAKQLFRYGFWKVKTIRKHPDFFRTSFVVPTFFILALLILLAIGFLYKPFFYLFIAQLIIYLSILFLFSLWLSFKEGLKYFLVLPVIYLVIHISIGFGFLVGLLKWRS